MTAPRQLAARWSFVSAFTLLGIVAGLFELPDGCEAAVSPAPRSLAGDVVPGGSSRVGKYRAYSATEARRRSSPSFRNTLATFTPLYPESARPKEMEHTSLVTAWVGPSGRVDSATVVLTPQGKPWPDSTAAFDSAAVHAARRWIWEPSAASSQGFLIWFDFQVRAMDPAGEGSLVVVTEESVAHDTLDFARVQFANTRIGPESRGLSSSRFVDVPAGDRDVYVSAPRFLPAHAHAIVHAAREDTLTVVLEPEFPVVPGRTLFSHPAEDLPVRPEDEERFPAGSFRFLYETGWGDRVDSERGLVTKDQVSDPDTTIELRLSFGELERIRRKMIAIRFFDMPEPHPPYPGVGGVQPSTTIHLEATAGGTTRRLEWQTGNSGGMYQPDDWKRLRDVIKLIQEILSARPEYRALPPARGAYL